MRRLSKKPSPNLHRDIEDCPVCHFHLFTFRRDQEIKVLIKCWNCDAEFQFVPNHKEGEPILTLIQTGDPS